MPPGRASETSPLLASGNSGRGTINMGPGDSKTGDTDVDDDEDEVILTSPKRWYMLSVLSLLAALQGAVWNTFGPINDAVKPVYGWKHDWMVALLANWGPVCYIFAVLPSSWALDAKGLRYACLGAALLVFVGSGLRCFTTRDVAGTALVHVGQILNGLAGPVAMSAPPLLSSVWFPRNERTTATSIMAIANYAGVAASFIAGPKLVPIYSGEDNTHLSHDVLHRRSKDILIYMWGQTVLAGICLAAVVIHFPSRPKNCPSRSASKDRTEFWQGIKQLLHHRAFFILALAYGIMTGVYSGWGAFLSPNLQHFIHPESRAENLSSWLGFWATIAGCGAGLSLGFVADLVGGKVKALLLGVSLGAAGVCAWFALACEGVVGNSTAVLYASCILGGWFINGTVPLFYEMAVETTYPIAEGSTTCLLTTFNNIGCLVFLFLPFDTSLGSSWANWTLLAACCVGFVSMLFFPEHYRRTSVDLGSKVYDVDVSKSRPSPDSA